MLCSAYQLAADQVGAGLLPDPTLTVSQWADANRVLDSKSSPEPGRWRTSRTPYLRELQDNLSISSPVIEFCFMKPTQIGGTALMENGVGYVVDHAPGPGLFLQPSQDLAQRLVKQKIDPMIEACPTLAAKFPGKRGAGGNNLEEKDFAGGVWFFKWASSTAGLRSASIRYLYMDELDEWKVEIGDQGDPEQLARNRTNAFGKRKKIVAASTPTNTGSSKISALYDDSDQRVYKMPCPYCDLPIVFLFKHLRWTKGLPETARYHCQECEGVIDEYRKTWMLEEADRRNVAGDKRFGWVPQNPDNRHRRGYHLTALYSPVGFKSWEEIALEWEGAQGKPAKLKTFTNCVLAETWNEAGEAPDTDKLFRRREKFERNVVPLGGLLLYAGVDVQRGAGGGKNGWLDVTLWAYGRNRERWLVDHRQFMGDTSDEKAPDSPWLKLEGMLSEVWPHTHAGVAMKLQAMGVDSGDQSATVYRWAAMQDPARVKVLKGENLTVMVASAKNVASDDKGKRAKRGVKLYRVGVNLIKDELYADLARLPAGLGEAAPTGFIHFPEALDPEFFAQLTGERRVQRLVRGKVAILWEPTRPRVEVLDTAVYARATAYLAGVDRFTEEYWQAVEESLGLEKTPAPAADPDPAASNQVEKPEIRKSGNQEPAAVPGRKRSTYWDRRH
jgi:phage terminase large subunit GpA-like protein